MPHHPVPRRPLPVRRRGRRLLVAVAVAACGALVLGTSAGAAADVVAGTPGTGSTTAASVAATGPWGVYVGPGAKNVAGAPVFAAATGVPVTRVVDFLPTGSWAAMTGAGWLLTPYRGQPVALELSVPMLPDDKAPGGKPWTLAGCASGAYDGQWATLGRLLVTSGVPTTRVRPGWEFNGTWYRWSAAFQAANYRGCFQHVVTTMRAVPGAQFSFDWNPNLGAGTFPAENAYPGDAYVDVVGVDVYDLSWSWYPTPAGVDPTRARELAWAWLARGDHGLVFWSAFARAHAKPLSVTEWGATIRPDGHGGGDNPYFIDRMLDFLTDPANNVTASHYFNIDTTTVRHDLTRDGTAFPDAAARLRARAAALTLTTPGAWAPASPVRPRLLRPSW
jgi:hypothetical protein